MATDIFKSMSWLFVSIAVHFQIAASKNRVYLNAGSLMLNINEKEFDENLESQLVRGKKK